MAPAKPYPYPCQDTPAPAWKLLLVAEERDLGARLRASLGDMAVEGRPIQVLEAVTLDQAWQLSEVHPDLVMLILSRAMAAQPAGTRWLERLRSAPDSPRPSVLLLMGDGADAMPNHLSLTSQTSGWLSPADLTPDALRAPLQAAIWAERLGRSGNGQLAPWRQPPGAPASIQDPDLPFPHPQREPVPATAALANQQYLAETHGALDQAGIGVLWVDLTGRLEYGNSAVCALLGYSQAELLALALGDLVPQLSPQRFQDQALLPRRPGHTRVEAQPRHRDGHRVAVELNFCYRPDGDQGGRFIVFVQDRAPASPSGAAPGGSQGASPDLRELLARLPGLDLVVGLRVTRNKPERLLHLLGLLVTRQRQDLPQLLGHLSTGDLDAAERLAHSLKGAAGTLGLIRLQALATDLDLGLRQGWARHQLDGLAAALEQDFQALAAALEALPAPPNP